MDTKLYQSYLDIQDKEAELKKHYKNLKNQLYKVEQEQADTNGARVEAESKVNPDNLITAKTVAQINDLLSGGCSLRIGGSPCPVNYVHLAKDGDKVKLDVVLAQPIFRGWRTETPYVSFQVCSLSVDTQPKTDENHIPEYISVLDMELELSCWEMADGSVMLYSRGGDGKVVFVLNSSMKESK